MIEVYTGLYIGSQGDYEGRVRSVADWRVVHACKEPYHRLALGYSGRAADRSHPEYLTASRGDRLILNLVDADDPAFIPKEVIDTAISFVHETLVEGRRVLVHCNQGQSRSPSIGLLYLAVHTDHLSISTFEEAEVAFRGLYPNYRPALGVRGFLRRNWNAYIGSELDRGL